jgi:hypothetical protein
MGIVPPSPPPVLGYTLFSTRHDAFFRGHKENDRKYTHEWVELGRSAFLREEPLDFIAMHHHGMVEYTRSLNESQQEAYTKFFGTDAGAQALSLYVFIATDGGWGSILIVPTVEGVWERDFSKAFKLDGCGF